MRNLLLLYISSIFIVSILTTSCIVVNLTKGKECPDYCNYHHELNGKKAIVSTRYGKLNSDGYAYPYAKKPHSMGCVVPIWPKHRLAKIYVCKQCTRAYHHHQKEQRKNKKRNNGFIPMQEF